MVPAYELPVRTRTLCRWLKWLTLASAFAYVAISVWDNAIEQSLDAYWNELGELDEKARSFVKTGTFKKGLLHFIAFIQLTAPLLFILAAMRVFAVFEKGQAFSVGVLKAIRLLAITAIVTALVRIMSYSAMLITLTYDNPPGHRLLYFSLNNNQIMSLLIGVIFLIIAQILTQAAAISQENRQIV